MVVAVPAIILFSFYNEFRAKVSPINDFTTLICNLLTIVVTGWICYKSWNLKRVEDIATRQANEDKVAFLSPHWYNHSNLNTNVNVSSR